MIKKLTFVLSCVSILLSVFLVSCAKEGMPQGGPRDTIPPVLEWSKPPKFATDFKGNKIIFKFDEFFELKDLDKNFFASPPFAEKPRFSINGKKLILHLRDTLRDSSTYTLDFGDAIVDYHEGNVLKNFKFIFSTYNQIDTLQIPGKIVDAQTLEPISGAYIMLYKKNIDTIVFAQPPQYIARSNDSGDFVLFGLKEGRYKVFALNDLNNDFMYDGIENQIAFLDTLVQPEVDVTIERDTLRAGTILHDTINNIIDTLKKDTVIVRRIINFYPYLNLYMFTENTRPQQIVSASRPYPFLVTIRFNLPLIDNFYTVKLQKPANYNTGAYKPEYFYGSDSLWIWLTDKDLQKTDSLQFIFSIYTPLKNGKKLIVDTATVSVPIDSVLPLKIWFDKQKVNFFDSLSLNVNQLLAKFDTQKVEIAQQIDTSLYHTRQIKTSCLRVNPNLIQVLFSHSIDTQTVHIFINNASPTEYTHYFDNTRTVLNIKLDQRLSNLDTIPLELFYRVKRFFNYYEPHLCRQKLTLVRQQLVKYVWSEPRRIDLFFVKPISDLQIQNTDLDSFKVNKTHLTLWLKNFQDSLELDVKMLDFTELTVHPTYYVKTLKLKYDFTPNVPEKYARTRRDLAKIKFRKPITNLAFVKTLENQAPTAIKYSIKGDTLIVQFLDKKLKQDKFVKIVTGLREQVGDSLKIITDTIEVKHGENQFLTKTTILKPTSFSITSDTSNYLKFFIRSKLKPNAKYLVYFLPQTFKLLTGSTIDSVMTLNFGTTSENDYGSISFDITDSSGTLAKTQLILQIYQDKDLVRQKIVTATGKVVFQKLAAGNYTLRIIYDRNRNGHWDTGNYLRKEQPEKVVIYPKKIKIKPGWEMEEPINLN